MIFICSSPSYEIPFSSVVIVSSSTKHFFVSIYNSGTWIIVLINIRAHQVPRPCSDTTIMSLFEFLLNEQFFHFFPNFESNWRSLELVVSIYRELKFGEFEHIGKINHKGHYRGIKAWYWNLMWSNIYEENNSGTTIRYWNQKCLCWTGKKIRRRRQFFEETMTRDEKGASYDSKEHIKTMEPIF